MKISTILCTGWFALFLSFMIACHIDSGQNISENNTVPILKKTPAMVEGRLINEAGWRVPSNTGTKSWPPTVKKFNSLEGKSFAVKIAFFVPNERVLFSEELFSENVTRLHGELILDSFEEYSCNDKVYLYSIVAKENENISRTDANYHSDKLIYQILDTDGDGIFETLIDNDSNVLIPKWVTK